MTTLVSIPHGIRPPISKPLRDLRLEPGSRMTIPAVTWEEFEEILVEMGDRSGLGSREFGSVGRSRRSIASFDVVIY